MRKNVVRMVAVAMAVGATVATSGALAAASSAPGGHSVQSITIDPQATAKGLQKLHDRLESAAHHGDLATTKSTVADVRAVLGQVKQHSTQWSVQSETVSTVDKAKQQSVTLTSKLDALPDGVSAQAGQVPALPTLPEPLASVSALIQGLLANLQGIVNGLLPIGLPPGVPVPVVPGS